MSSIFHETCSLLQLRVYSFQAMIQSHLMQMAMVIGPSSSWICFFFFIMCIEASVGVFTERIKHLDHLL